MKKITIIIFFIINILSAAYGFGTLNIELTQGVNAAIPIAVVPFSNNDLDNSISAIVRHDLYYSGQFNIITNIAQEKTPHTIQEVNLPLWARNKVDHILIGQVMEAPGKRLKVRIALIETFKSSQAGKPKNQTDTVSHDQVLIEKTFYALKTNNRQIAHKISDEVYRALLGENGIFSTKIAYVEVEKKQDDKVRYLLQVADADGYGAQTLLNSPEPIMSPAWSPDGRKLAYVSFEHKRAQVFVSDLQSGKRRRISHYPGINGAPAWSPDGRKLALVLSKDGYPNIYEYQLQTNTLKQLTFDNVIATEPSYSPDGKKLLFTSDRGGVPQIYELVLASREINRLTFDGNYNARASYTPNGDKIVMLHRETGERAFSIATLDMQNGYTQVLTENEMTESPSLAPNGRMVLYSTEMGDKQILRVVSIDGKISLRLPAPGMSVREPAWSPYLS